MKTKNNGLLIVALVVLVLVLAFLFTNYGGFGKASVTDRLQQYKSAEEGEACVIDANCVDPLECRNNVCRTGDSGGPGGDDKPPGEHEYETPEGPGSD
ncbi:MAG: hypothetical protein PHU71_00470 [Candidatus Gracilibacteria bacterium]|nr:hypothetical protein [Candidatus Gracilibacteria bacterium]